MELSPVSALWQNCRAVAIVESVEDLKAYVNAPSNWLLVRVCDNNRGGFIFYLGWPGDPDTAVYPELETDESYFVSEYQKPFISLGFRIR